VAAEEQAAPLMEQLIIKNATQETLYIAVGYYNADFDDFVSKGWWKVAPGKDSPAFGPARAGFCTYYSAHIDGLGWGSDAAYFWVHPTKKFTDILVSLPYDDAMEQGFESVGFVETCGNQRVKLGYN